jgi:hypothetical protein
MTLLTRLENWKERGLISAEQQGLLAGLWRREPFSVFLELNVLLYLGVLSFIGGLGWTVSTWSQQLGEVLVLAVLFALFAGCLWYCFSRVAAWSPEEVAPPSFVFDYVLYFGCLVWGVALTLVEARFRLLSGQWDLYLLASSGLYFFLAYRFDNRFVLSLALASLAGYFGIAISNWRPRQDAEYRQFAILYGLIVGGAGALLHRQGLKAHFLGTYLNLAANVLFWAVLSGVFQPQGYFGWFLLLVVVCGAALAWGLHKRQFAFVGYAAVYGYVGVSAILLREMRDLIAVLAYFVVTGVAMLVILIAVARRFGREQ